MVSNINFPLILLHTSVIRKERRLRIEFNGEKEVVNDRNIVAQSDLIKIFGQAIKGCWGMPWHRQAKKDVLPAKSIGEPEGVMIR
jgi:hypothetical protein